MARTTDNPVPRVVSLRLPFEVAAALEAAAEAAGAGLSEHLRDRLTASLSYMEVADAEPDAARLTEADRRRLARASALFGRAGGLLNQTVRALNAARLAGVEIDAATLAQLADEIAALAAARIELVRAAEPYARRPSVALRPR